MNNYYYAIKTTIIVGWTINTTRFKGRVIKACILVSDSVTDIGILEEISECAEEGTLTCRQLGTTGNQTM